MFALSGAGGAFEGKIVGAIKKNRVRELQNAFAGNKTSILLGSRFHAINVFHYTYLCLFCYHVCLCHEP